MKRGEDRSRESSEEAVIQAGERGGLDQGGGGGEKWPDSADVFKAEMTGVADGGRCERKTELEDGFQHF